jgi:hypothetical protein
VAAGYRTGEEITLVSACVAEQENRFILAESAETGAERAETTNIGRTLVACRAFKRARARGGPDCFNDRAQTSLWKTHKV